MAFNNFSYLIVYICINSCEAQGQFNKTMHGLLEKMSWINETFWEVKEKNLKFKVRDKRWHLFIMEDYAQLGAKVNG